MFKLLASTQTHKNHTALSWGQAGWAVEGNTTFLVTGDILCVFLFFITNLLISVSFWRTNLVLQILAKYPIPFISFQSFLWGISAYSSQCFVSKDVKGLIPSVARIPCAHTALWLSIKPGTLGVSNTAPPELQSLPLSPTSPSQRPPGLVSLLGINRKMSAALWMCLGCGHPPMYDFVLRVMSLTDL